MEMVRLFHAEVLVPEFVVPFSPSADFSGHFFPVLFFLLEQPFLKHVDFQLQGFVFAFERKEYLLVGLHDLLEIVLELRMADFYCFRCRSAGFCILNVTNKVFINPSFLQHLLLNVCGILFFDQSLGLQLQLLDIL